MMAPGPKSTLAIALAFICLIHAGEGLRCWVCSSDAESDRGYCSDPFNTTQRRYLLVDCERERSPSFYRGQSVCRKLKQHVNGQDIVVRSCAWKSDREDDAPCSPGSLHQFAQVEHCSTCESEECNSAVRLDALGLPIALASASFYRLFG